jgi:hypothetical protein
LKRTTPTRVLAVAPMRATAKDSETNRAVADWRLTALPGRSILESCIAAAILSFFRSSAAGRQEL